MADVIIYTRDLTRYVLDRLFDNLTDKSQLNVEANAIRYASNNHSWDQIEILTGNRSIFDRFWSFVVSVNWEIYRIPK